jgi:hypothetical protein
VSAHVSSGRAYFTVAIFHAPVAFGRSFLDASSEKSLAAFARDRSEVNARRGRLADVARKALKYLGHSWTVGIFLTSNNHNNKNVFFQKDRSYYFRDQPNLPEFVMPTSLHF